jgi:hypothetical protein
LTPHRLLSVAAVVLCIGIILFACGRSYLRSRALEAHSRTRFNLSIIQGAINSYHAAHNQAPPSILRDESGKALHSWRSLVLPFLAEDIRDEYASIDLSLPWNSSVNMAAAAKAPRCYRHPLMRDCDPNRCGFFAVVDDNERLCWEALVVEVLSARKLWHEPGDIDIRKFCDLLEGVRDETFTLFPDFTTGNIKGPIVVFPSGASRRHVDAFLREIPFANDVTSETLRPQFEPNPLPMHSLWQSSWR